jgi:hypothetical protein
MMSWSFAHLVRRLVGIVHHQFVVAVEIACFSATPSMTLPITSLALVELRLLRQVSEVAPSASHASPVNSLSSPP